MNPTELKNLLEAVASGATTPGAAMERLRSLPFTDLGHTKLDLHRAVRHGAPEVIFCKGKTPEQVLSIAQSLLGNGQHLLATRAGADTFEHCRGRIPELRFHPASGVMTNLELDEAHGRGLVLVVSAGTSDLPVAEEALLTARACGSRARLIQDVGVSGLHRILSHVEDLQRASAIVVCAGMEGALPSVVGGLVAAPVIAVPTSVGYGASFGGLAALLGMLNSCAASVSVVNIDNGFGAGYVASLINLRSQSGGREP